MKTTQVRFFSVEAVGPWGDYGQLLAHGFALEFPTKDGMYVIARTGPYIPAITKPHGLVVTDQGKEALIACGIMDVEFHDVIIGRVAYSDWQNWDKTCDWPEQLRDAGEPESIILGGASCDLSATPGSRLYEVRLSSRIPIRFVRDRVNEFDEVYQPLVAFVDVKDWDGSEVFTGLPDGRDSTSCNRIVICTKKGRSMLESIDVGFLRFRPCNELSAKAHGLKVFNPEN